MTFDVKTFITPLPDGRLQVNPDEAYPAVLARIKEVLAGAAPEEIAEPGVQNVWRDQTVMRFLDALEQVPSGAWDAALIEWSPDQPAATMEIRAVGLDWIFTWLKRAMVVAYGMPVRIHLTKSPKWKR